MACEAMLSAVANTTVPRPCERCVDIIGVVPRNTGCWKAADTKVTPSDAVRLAGQDGRASLPVSRHARGSYARRPGGATGVSRSAIP
jgi:hypothetical protein